MTTPDELLRLAERVEQLEPEWFGMGCAPDNAAIIYEGEDGSIGRCQWQQDYSVEKDDARGWWDLDADQYAYPVKWMPLPENKGRSSRARLAALLRAVAGKEA